MRVIRSRQKTKAGRRLAPATWLVFVCAAGIAGGLTMGSRVVFATELAPVPIRITEELHDGCPREPAMQRRLAEQNAVVREAMPGEPSMDLRFRVERRGAVSDGSLTIVAGGASVERVASSPSCADVLAALSMMAAVAIGERRTSPPAEEPATAEERRPPASAASAPPTRPAGKTKESPRAKPRRPARPRLGIGAGFEANGNHGTTILATWFGQITFPARVAPTIRVGFARSTNERVTSLRGGAAVRWTEATLVPCVDLLNERALRLGPCANLEVGLIEATPIAPLPARTFSYLWLTAGLSAKLSWRVLPSLSIDLAAGARTPLARSELFFEQDTSSPVYEAPAFIPFAALGFVANLP